MGREKSGVQYNMTVSKMETTILYCGLLSATVAVRVIDCRCVERLSQAAAAVS